MSKRGKVVVIGLDGATFEVIDPLIQEGKLPNMSRLIQEGVRAQLLSIIPPVTAPSWASFMTGKNPGAHGIFDFFKSVPRDFKKNIVNYKHIKSKTLWSLLSENGKRICVINVPLTYPPPQVNGFLISGMLTPNIQSQYTYPASLSKHIKKKFGEYTLDIGWQQYGFKCIKKLLKDIMDCTDQRSKITLHLMQKEEWDFFMVVFTGTDRIQHSLWNFLFPTNSNNLSRTEREIRKLIIEYYQHIDDTIGKIVSFTDRDANIIIMSDHGFGPLKGKVYINKWLEDMGLLSYDPIKIRKFRMKTKLIPTFKQMVRRVDFLNLRKKLISINIKRTARMGAHSFLDCIDWSNTMAYAASKTEQGIYLNLAGREPLGIVKPGKDCEEIIKLIMKKLKEFEHPHTKEKIVSRIYKKEEIYSGPYIDYAPDIIFLLKDGEYLADVQPIDYLFEEPSWKTGSGTHRLEGLLIAYGNDIKGAVHVSNVRIIDLAPTILSMLNVPIPDDIDGRVLKEIFTYEFFRDNQPKYIKTSQEDYSDSGLDQIYSDRETSKVIEKLKDLGYLS